MQKFIAIALLAIFVFPLQMNAQEEEKGGEFSIDINLRPRFEYRNGYSYPRLETDKPSAFISNRARIGANFDNGFLSARVAAQISRSGDRSVKTITTVHVLPCMKHGHKCDTTGSLPK